MATDQIWRRWRASYQSDQAECLVEDGFCDEAAYRASEPRLLVVLKETNSRGGRFNGVRLTAQLREGAKYNLWHRIGEWAAGFHMNFPPYDDVAGKPVKDEALGKIAAINLKKIPGKNTSIEKIIDAYAFRDRLLLREQVADLDPEVILCCGTFNPMCWLLESHISAGAYLPKIVAMNNGAKIVKWDHPSRRGLDKQEWYENLAQIWRNQST